MRGIVAGGVHAGRVAQHGTLWRRSGRLCTCSTEFFHPINGRTVLGRCTRSAKAEGASKETRSCPSSLQWGSTAHLRHGAVADLFVREFEGEPESPFLAAAAAGAMRSLTGTILQDLSTGVRPATHEPGVRRRGVWRALPSLAKRSLAKPTAAKPITKFGEHLFLFSWSGWGPVQVGVRVGARRLGPLKGGAPKISRFFFPLQPQFSFFLSSLSLVWSSRV